MAGIVEELERMERGQAPDGLGFVPDANREQPMNQRPGLGLGAAFTPQEARMAQQPPDRMQRMQELARQALGQAPSPPAAGMGQQPVGQIAPAAGQQAPAMTQPIDVPSMAGPVSQQIDPEVEREIAIAEEQIKTLQDHIRMLRRGR